MTSYETCTACHGREAFNLGKCDKCTHKLASIPKVLGKRTLEEENSNSNKKPYWISLYESQFGSIQNN
jgi:hypothetical protein